MVSLFQKRIKWIGIFNGNLRFRSIDIFVFGYIGKMYYLFFRCLRFISMYNVSRGYFGKRGGFIVFWNR